MLDLVFPNRSGGMLAPHLVDRDGLHPALRRAGLRRITLHWLRHGYGALLVSAGVSLKVVQVSMGHASIAITLDVYGHVLPGDHETAAAAFSARVFGAPQTATENFLGTSGEKTAETRAVAGVVA